MVNAWKKKRGEKEDTAPGTLLRNTCFHLHPLASTRLNSYSQRNSAAQGDLGALPSPSGWGWFGLLQAHIRGTESRTPRASQGHSSGNNTPMPQREFVF